MIVFMGHGNMVKKNIKYSNTEKNMQLISAYQQEVFN